MKSILVILTAGLVFLLLCVSCPATAAGDDKFSVNEFTTGLDLFPQVIEPSGVSVQLDTTLIEKMIFNKMNKARTKRGIPKLVWSGSLHDSAESHSYNMFKAGGLFHYLAPGVYGQNVAYCMAGNVGFPCGGGVHYIPNTEGGIATAVMDMFMKHDKCQANGHRKNILRSSFRYAGVGVYTSGGIYWVTQNFAY